MDASQPLRYEPSVKPLVACLFAALAAGDLALTSVAAAATLPVTNCNDAGGGSLRAQLAAAHSGDTVDLGALACTKITLTTGALVVESDNLTIAGRRDAGISIVRADAAYGSVFHHGRSGILRLADLLVSSPNSSYYSYATEACITSEGTVDLDHVTVTRCGGSGVHARALSMRYSTVSYSQQGVSTSTTDAVIIGSTISGNGGYNYCTGLRLGILGQSGPTSIINTTISGNVSFWYGTTRGATNSSRGPSGAGCIYGTASLSHVTVAENVSWVAHDGRGGLKLLRVPAKIDNSLFAGNSGADLAVGPETAFAGTNNLIVASSSPVPSDTIRNDPLLMPLADNGGATRTHRLRSGSPAIDAGGPSSTPGADQRGLPYVRNAGLHPDIGAFEEQGTIGPHMTGSWFDPAQSGHGLMLEVLPDKRLLAMWFAFDPVGTRQAWFGGVGTYDGDTATIDDVSLPTGGGWVPGFNPASVVRNDWGSLTLKFDGGDKGNVSFLSTFGFGSGSMNLTRLTNAAVQGRVYPLGPIGAAMTGSWFNPAQSGHGLMIEALPGDGFLAFWFAFDPAQTSQAWFGGSGVRGDDTARVDDVFRPVGGRWIPNFNSQSVDAKRWGSLKFSFPDCNHARVEYESGAPFGKGSLDLTRLTLPAGITCP